MSLWGVVWGILRGKNEFIPFWSEAVTKKKKKMENMKRREYFLSALYITLLLCIPRNLSQRKEVSKSYLLSKTNVHFGKTHVLTVGDAAHGKHSLHPGKTLPLRFKPNIFKVVSKIDKELHPQKHLRCKIYS